MYIYTNHATKPRTFIIVAVLLLLLATRASFADAKQTKAPIPSPAAPMSNVAARYGLLPLSFVPNEGQSDAVVRYQTHAMGGMLFFEDDAVVLSLPTTDRGRQTEDQTRPVVRLHFDGVDDAHRVVSAKRLPGTVNYFIGNEPSRWLTDLSTYAGIVYEQIYPGIDLRYDGA